MHLVSFVIRLTEQIFQLIHVLLACLDCHALQSTFFSLQKRYVNVRATIFFFFLRFLLISAFSEEISWRDK